MMFNKTVENGSHPPAAPNERGDIEKTGDMGQTGAEEAENIQTSNWKKPYQFFLASSSLWLAVLLVSLDSAGLAVAIPVRSSSFP